MLISIKKVAKAVFSTAPLKGARPNTILAIVWQKLWPTIKNVVVSLFTASVGLDVMLE